MTPINRGILATSIMLLSGLAAGEPNVAAKSMLNIDSLPLVDALNKFADQTGLQVLVNTDEVASAQLTTSPVIGAYSAEVALSQLLTNTGLKYEFINERTVRIVSATVVPRQSSLQYSGEQTSGLVQTEKDGGDLWRRFYLAQANGGSSASNEGLSVDRSGVEKLEEIVVTARKREERLQDVPQSIGVLTGANLNALGLYAQQDYLRTIPGVAETNRGAWDNNIIIRGIATQVQQVGSPGAPGSTVATYFGETSITAAGGMGGGGVDIRPVDIERVEVLRGPQGTTFGAASISGAVRTLPRLPDVDGFSGSLSATVSETSGPGSVNHNYQAVVNIPIIENVLAIRAVAYNYFDSGYYRNVIGNTPSAITYAETYGISGVPDYTQSGNGELITDGARLSALWEVSPQFSVNASYLVQSIEQNGSPSSDFGGPFDQLRFPVPARHRVNGQPGEAADGKIEIFNVTANYDLGFGDLTATGSRVDASSHNVVSHFASNGSPLGFFYPSTFESKSGEIRFSSSWESPLQLLVGVFHQKINETTASGAMWLGSPATNIFSPDNPDDVVALVSGGRNNKETAVFGEVSYDITERLTATVGARHWSYDRTLTNLGEGPLFRVPFGTATKQVFFIKESGETYKTSLDFKITENSLVYASWSQGFRLGNPVSGAGPLCDINNDGLIDGTSVTVESTRKISSDSLDQYEAGAKFSLFNARLNVDASAYYMDWQQLPVTTTVQLPQGGTCGYVANAGSAESKGFDLQATWRATDPFTLGFGMGFNKANITEAVPAQNWPANARLPGSPEFNANVSSQYDFNLSGHDAFVRADVTYVGSFYGDILESPNLRAGDYLQLNTRAGITVSGVQIHAFVRNLTDASDVTYRNFFTSNRPDTYRLQPRTFGIQLTYDWGK